jgi:hypothetical protein
MCERIEKESKGRCLWLHLEPARETEAVAA